MFEPSYRSNLIHIQAPQASPIPSPRLHDREVVMQLAKCAMHVMQHLPEEPLGLSDASGRWRWVLRFE